MASFYPIKNVLELSTNTDARPTDQALTKLSRLRETRERSLERWTERQVEIQLQHLAIDTTRTIRRRQSKFFSNCSLANK